MLSLVCCCPRPWRASKARGRGNDRSRQRSTAPRALLDGRAILQRSPCQWHQKARMVGLSPRRLTAAQCRSRTTLPPPPVVLLRWSPQGDRVRGRCVSSTRSGRRSVKLGDRLQARRPPHRHALRLRATLMTHICFILIYACGERRVHVRVRAVP